MENRRSQPAGATGPMLRAPGHTRNTRIPTGKTAARNTRERLIPAAYPHVLLPSQKHASNQQLWQINNKELEEPIIIFRKR